MNTPSIDLLEPGRSQPGEESPTQPLVMMGELYRAYTQELIRQKKHNALAYFKSALLRYSNPK